MNKKSWTNEEDLLLTKMNDENRTLDEIAKRLGRSKIAVKQRRYTLFLQWPELQYAVYRGDDYVHSGNVEECAAKLGCSINHLLKINSPSYVESIKKYKATKNRISVIKLN